MLISNWEIFNLKIAMMGYAGGGDSTGAHDTGSHGGGGSIGGGSSSSGGGNSSGGSDNDHGPDPEGADTETGGFGSSDPDGEGDGDHGGWSADPVSSGDPTSMGFGGTLEGGGLGLSEGGTTGDSELDAYLTETLSDVAFSNTVKQSTLMGDISGVTVAKTLNVVGKALTAVGMFTGTAPAVAAGVISGLASRMVKAFSTVEKTEETSTEAGTVETFSQYKEKKQEDNPETQMIRETPRKEEKKTSAGAANGGSNLENIKQSQLQEQETQEFDYENIYGTLPGVNYEYYDDILTHLEESQGRAQAALQRVRDFLQREQA